MKKKQTQQAAFTLAEVLITIGIIGVVCHRAFDRNSTNTNCYSSSSAK